MAKEKVIKIHEFQNHKNGFDKCQNVDIRQPATLINSCIVGAPLLRDYLVAITAPEKRRHDKALKRQFNEDHDGNVYKTTKAKVKAMMVYK